MFSYSLKFEPLKCRFFVWNLSREKHEIQHGCCHFAAVREILSKWPPTSLLTTTLGFGCCWVVLFPTKHAPNSKNYSSEDNEVDNRLGKIHFCWPCVGCKSSCRFFYFPPISSRLTSTVSKRRRPKSSHKKNFFRIVATLESETSVSGRPQG